MISKIVTQGFGENGLSIVTQGFGVFDTASLPQPTPVIVSSGDYVNDYINQGITSIRNGRVSVGLGRRGGYQVLNSTRETNNQKDKMDTRLGPQFGVRLDRFYLDYPGQKEGIGM